MSELCSETYALVFSLNVSDAMISAVLNTFCNPADSKLNAARNVTVGLMRAHGHEHVWEVLYGNAQVRPWAVFPFVS